MGVYYVSGSINGRLVPVRVMFNWLIMGEWELLTSTPECVVSPRGETTHEGVNTNHKYSAKINPDYDMKQT